MPGTAVQYPNNCVHPFPPPPPRSVPVSPIPQRRAFVYTAPTPTSNNNGGSSLDYGEVIRSLRKIGPIQYDQEVTKKLTVAADALRKDWEARNRARLERVNAASAGQVNT